ncbi:unnamed protein product [Cyprideis torosa]|uniref:Uncharacterized protein n=1 Tax=Cyprideis torosa TaxID=163714 RepID=A0A7R8ZN03_9CRUS|nr:unnamed protein product [Cyprideis torosa]CAG0886767.1 unnamed protein product [Cyprideis torosa]
MLWRRCSVLQTLSPVSVQVRIRFRDGRIMKWTTCLGESTVLQLVILQLVFLQAVLSVFPAEKRQALIPGLRLGRRSVPLDGEPEPEWGAGNAGLDENEEEESPHHYRETPVHRVVSSGRNQGQASKKKHEHSVNEKRALWINPRLGKRRGREMPTPTFMDLAPYVFMSMTEEKQVFYKANKMTVCNLGDLHVMAGNQNSPKLHILECLLLCGIRGQFTLREWANLLRKRMEGLAATVSDVKDKLAELRARIALCIRRLHRANVSAFPLLDAFLPEEADRPFWGPGGEAVDDLKESIAAHLEKLKRIRRRRTVVQRPIQSGRGRRNRGGGGAGDAPRTESQQWPRQSSE